jgi:hypothetical protein
MSDLVWLWTAPTAFLLPTFGESGLIPSSGQVFFVFLNPEDETKTQTETSVTDYTLTLRNISEDRIAQEHRRTNNSLPLSVPKTH